MTEKEKLYFSDMYDKYAKQMYGICFLYLKNKADAEEAVSEAFTRLMGRTPQFENENHAKAFLTRVCINICKDVLKSGWRKHVVQSEDILVYMTTKEEKSIMEDVFTLPPKYRIILYMHYYQGYTTQEIADMLHMRQSSVLSRLSRGRKKLKEILTDGGFNYV